MSRSKTRNSPWLFIVAFLIIGALITLSRTRPDDAEIIRRHNAAVSRMNLQETVVHAAGKTIRAIAVSKNGQRFAYAEGQDVQVGSSPAQTQSLWELAGAFPDVREVTALAWSPDGTYLASLHSDDKTHIWEVIQIGSKVSTKLHGVVNAARPSEKTRSLAFAPTAGDYRLACGSDDSILIFNAKEGMKPPKVISTKSPVNSLVWGPQELFSASNAQVTAWDPTTREHLLELPRSPEDGEVGYLALSPSGKYLAGGATETGTNAGILTVWDLDTRVAWRLSPGTVPTVAATWTSEAIIVTAGKDAKLKAWDVTSLGLGDPQPLWSEKVDNAPTSIATDGKRLWIGTTKGLIDMPLPKLTPKGDGPVAPVSEAERAELDKLERQFRDQALREAYEDWKKPEAGKLATDLIKEFGPREPGEPPFFTEAHERWADEKVRRLRQTEYDREDRKRVDNEVRQYRNAQEQKAAPGTAAEAYERWWKRETKPPAPANP